LKHGEHGVADVVEADNAVLRALPERLALGHVLRASETATAKQ